MSALIDIAPVLMAVVTVARTADSHAMDLIAADWNAVRMPLSINYRCSKAVVRNAQTMVPELEAWEQSPEGSVETVHGDLFLHQFEQTDAVICRVNAPNIGLYYKLTAAGMACQVTCIKYAGAMCT